MKIFLKQITGILFFYSASLYAAPSADLWEYWAQHDVKSTQAINHEIWSRLLNRYLTKSKDGINRFAYSEITEQDKQQLKGYISSLADTRITAFSRNQQRAFWINLYNALTIDVILDNYPVDSIRDIRSGFFSSGPWSLELISIEGKQLTLDDIEHRILRPVWKDPRIHYAVNCASIGCPNLQQEAFTAENMEKLLNNAAKEFINHPRAASVEGDDLLVSSIYDWFADDFGGESGVISHIKQYANEPLATALDNIHEIDDYEYDWRLNNADN